MSQQIQLEIVSQNVEKFNFGLEIGGLPLITPINPYLEQNTWEKGHIFVNQTLF